MAQYDPTFVFDAEYEDMLDYHLAIKAALLSDPDLYAALSLPLVSQDGAETPEEDETACCNEDDAFKP